MSVSQISTLPMALLSLSCNTRGLHSLRKSSRTCCRAAEIPWQCHEDAAHVPRRRPASVRFPSIRLRSITSQSIRLKAKSHYCSHREKQEQNTQQSPGFAAKSLLHNLQRCIRIQVSGGTISSEARRQSGQERIEVRFSIPLGRANEFSFIFSL